jgi:hypothetical protein
MNDEIDEHAVAYDFVQLGEALADTLTRAAEEQVQRAQAILDQTKSMADIIRTQVKAQAEQIEEMNERFKAFGEQMLDAHRKLNGSDERPVTPHRVVERVEAPADIARLRALDSTIRGRRDADQSDTAKLIRDHDRKQRQESAARHRELPNAVATGEPYAPWVGAGANNGENRGDRPPGGTGS